MFEKNRVTEIRVYRQVPQVRDRRVLTLAASPLRLGDLREGSLAQLRQLLDGLECLGFGGDALGAGLARHLRGGGHGREGDHALELVELRTKLRYLILLDLELPLEVLDEVVLPGEDLQHLQGSHVGAGGGSGGSLLDTVQRQWHGPTRITSTAARPRLTRPSTHGPTTDRTRAAVC